MISTVRPVPTPGTSTTEGTTTGEQKGLPLVGRSELLDRAVNLVLVGGNVLLFGADGCGRTAVLHEVVHRLATEERATVLIDGSGVDEPRRLVSLIVRACGLTVPADLDVPSMLGCLPAPAAAQRVIAIDDLEVSAGQELFGQVAPPPLAPWGPSGWSSVAATIRRPTWTPAPTTGGRTGFCPFPHSVQRRRESS